MEMYILGSIVWEINVVMGFSNGKMVMFMKGSGRTAKLMVKELRSILMAIAIKVNGGTIKGMVFSWSLIVMAIGLRVIIYRIRRMAKVYLLMLTAINIRESGLMARK